MKKVSFDYSLKNIPVPNKDAFLKALIDQTTKLFQRIRWKVFWEENKKKPQSQFETYGFKTEKCAPKHKELNKFESDVVNLIHSLEYRPNTTKFQQKLLQDVKKIKKRETILLPADKTSNMYEIDKKDYNKLVRDNVTSEYKIAPRRLEEQINRRARNLAENLKLDKRIEVIAHKDAYVTLKDHKPNFENNPKCRLINPAKSNMGRISKIELQKINAKIREETGLLQWRNTASVLQWFKGLENKSSLEFIQFDIVNFYPSITEKLFDDAIEFARTIIDIPQNIVDIVKNARESLLFHDGKVWQKETGIFDVTMGAYDGAEVCELVGLLILDRLRRHFPEINSGLYRDDGLGVNKRISKCKMERKKKAIIKMFKDMGLEITIDTNMATANFLDATLSIKDGKFWPYAKPNNTVQYVHTQSNHPKHVIKQIPVGINKRLCAISCDKEHFDRAKPEYEKALKDSGHKVDLEFTEVEENVSKSKRSRHKNIIWYNPPFNSEVKTQFGKDFLKILDNNFPKKHPFSKFLNRHTVKISYSCTKNMGAIIAAHNKKLLGSENVNAERDCNCQPRNRPNCPLRGKCCTQSIVYKAEIQVNNVTKNYYGLTEGEFKTRYGEHKNSFCNWKKKSRTALSSLVWKEGLNPTPNVHWEIAKKCPSYKPGQKVCDLCATEKLFILKADKDANNINVRNEMGTLCRHRNNYKLSECLKGS